MSSSTVAESVDVVKGADGPAEVKHEPVWDVLTATKPIVKGVGDLFQKVARSMDWFVEYIKELVRRFSLKWLLQNGMYWLWTIFAKVGLGIIYLAVITEGLRLTFPVLAQKLYKLPLLGFLRDYEVTYNLDLAPFFAMFFLVACFHLWERKLQFWLCPLENELGFEPTFHGFLLTVLGWAIIGSDAFFFYRAVSRMGWGGGLSFTALIGTVAYVAVIVFVSYVSVCLRRKIVLTELKNEERNYE